MEDLSSNMPLPEGIEIECLCLLGDNGFGVLDGETEADRLGGEPGGVKRGVLFCDASKKVCGARGLAAVSREKDDHHTFCLFTYFSIELWSFTVTKGRNAKKKPKQI